MPFFTTELGDASGFEFGRRFHRERKWYVVDYGSGEAVAAFVDPADAEAFAQFCEDRTKPLPNVGD